MLKISINDLNDLCKDPVAYKSKLTNAAPRGFGGPSYFQTLKNGIFHYHKTNNFTDTMNYFEIHLERFKNNKKCEEVIENFHWYISEKDRINWPTFQTKLKNQIPLSTVSADSLLISGQVSKVDLNPNNGYGAWLFLNRDTKDWKSEVMMPIVQNAVSVQLNTDPTNVSIGIYNFSEKYTDSYIFSNNEIKKAHLLLENSLRQMGY